MVSTEPATGAVEDGGAAAGLSRKIRWEPFALVGILVGAALLYGWSLDGRVLQPYYAAAVHSMTHSGVAFLYAGYDQAGVVTIDKPPLAFWVQGLGTLVFGYHWWAIALVQLVEGVAAVFVLFCVVRRWAGEHTALLAAGLFALTPIMTAIDRDNVPDTLLVLLLLLAAYCTTRAVERGGLWWLAGAGALVGTGFLTKMLAAWLVLPALALAFLAAPVSWPRRIGGLALGGVATAVMSFWWPVMVALTPAADRPYIGSTTDNSIWQLIFAYNGFGRVVGAPAGPMGSFGSQFGGRLGGDPGPLRLLNSDVGGQIGWLLPLALVTLVVAVVRWARTRRGAGTELGGWLLWGGWFALTGVVFSSTGGMFHPYYTAELAPAVAVLAAKGLAVCWREFRRGSLAGLALPASVAVTAALAFLFLARTPDWLPWLRIAVIVVAGLTILAMLAVFPRRQGRSNRTVLVTVAVVGLVVMIAGPLAYSVSTATGGSNVLSAGDPAAGPAKSDVVGAIRDILASPGTIGSARASQLYLNYMENVYTLSPGQRQVLDYALAHAGNAAIPLAVEGGTYGADPFMMNTDAPVAAFGGYVGVDPDPSQAELVSWAGSGKLRYVLLPEVFLAIGKAMDGSRMGSRTGLGGGDNAIGHRIEWAFARCSLVRPATIGPDAATAGLLFDCAHPPAHR